MSDIPTQLTTALPSTCKEENLMLTSLTLNTVQETCKLGIQSSHPSPCGSPAV